MIKEAYNKIITTNQNKLHSVINNFLIMLTSLGTNYKVVVYIILDKYFLQKQKLKYFMLLIFSFFGSYNR